jgi:hypothetical protein
MFVHITPDYSRQKKKQKKQKCKSNFKNSEFFLRIMSFVVRILSFFVIILSFVVRTKAKAQAQAKVAPPLASGLLPIGYELVF